jgi:hypothetical protein
MVSIIWHSGKGKNIETVKSSIVTRGLGLGEVEYRKHMEFLG